MNNNNNNNNNIKLRTLQCSLTNVVSASSYPVSLNSESSQCQHFNVSLTTIINIKTGILLFRPYKQSLTTVLALCILPTLSSISGCCGRPVSSFSITIVWFRMAIHNVYAQNSSTYTGYALKWNNTVSKQFWNCFSFISMYGQFKKWGKINFNTSRQE